MRIFFSGGESKTHLDILRGRKAKNVLMTYYYLRQKLGSINLAQLKDEGYDVMLDSGTFTFKEAAAKKGIKLTITDFEEYLADYVKFIRENSKYLYCAVELDVYKLIGPEAVFKWHREHFYDLDTRVPIVYVWQPILHIYKLKEMLKWPCRYIGIGGYGRVVRDTVRRVFVIDALKAGIRTHGFALTRFRALRTMPFTSVDSSTWLGAARWGLSFVWKQGQNIIMFDKSCKYLRKQHKAFYEEAGADFKKVMEDDVNEVLKGNVLAMQKEEAFLTQMQDRTGIGGARWGK